IREISFDGRLRLAWVVNRNGYRQGARSLLSGATPAAIGDWLRFSGWRYWHIEGGAASGIDTMQDAIGAARNGVPSVIVLDSPKGWSGPATFGGRPFCGTVAAHKVPIRSSEVTEEVLDEIRCWLQSYRPEELFDIEGHPVAALSEALNNRSALVP